MQIPDSWIFFIVLGVFAGFVSGLLGIGSGVVIVPTLVLLFSFGQKNAQGTALAVMVPMTLVGALRYGRNPAININGAVVALIICGALVGVLIGTGLVGRLPGYALRRIFAICLFIVAVRMFVGSSVPKQPFEKHKPQVKTVGMVNTVETGNKIGEQSKQK